MTARDDIPALDPALVPPLVRGPAALAHRAFAGVAADELRACIRRGTDTLAEAAAFALDAATLQQLQFHAEPAAALQAQALAAAPLYRIAGGTGLRVLALMAPGDLMANTPLDFITAHLPVRLDLLFVRPGQALPPALPDHDLAIFAAADADPALLPRFAQLFARWPRPALNDPGRVLRLGRQAMATALRRVPGLLCPPVRRWSRAAALAEPAHLLPGAAFPLLLRPAGSHAGDGLVLAHDAAQAMELLAAMPAEDVLVTEFVDYRGQDGLFRKYRVAFIAGAPYLCHMAVSEHWMVHYLNAGMAESEAKRQAEAQAMAGFDAGFARRHADAFAAITEWAGLEYFQIDCAELPDGRLLLFEADVAGIVHMMDPPDLYPYKPPQMRRVIGAFGAMLERAAARRETCAMAG